MKKVAFHFSPKFHNAFGLLLIETMSPITLKIAQSGHTAHMVRAEIKLADLVWPKSESPTPRVIDSQLA